MDTYSVTDFKNQALRLLESLSKTGGDILVTKRGKPLAKVTAVRESRGFVLGKLKGTLVINGDIVEPLGDADWEAAH